MRPRVEPARQVRARTNPAHTHSGQSQRSVPASTMTQSLPPHRLAAQPQFNAPLHGSSTQEVNMAGPPTVSMQICPAAQVAVPQVTPPVPMPQVPRLSAAKQAAPQGQTPPPLHVCWAPQSASCQQLPVLGVGLHMPFTHSLPLPQSASALQQPVSHVHVPSWSATRQAAPQGHTLAP